MRPGVENKIKVMSGTLSAPALQRVWRSELAKLRSGKFIPEQLDLAVDPKSVRWAILDNGIQVHYRPGVVPRLLAQETENFDERLKIRSLRDKAPEGEFHFSSLPAGKAFAEFEYNGETFRLFPTKFATKEFMFLAASMSRAYQLLNWNDMGLMRELAQRGLIVMFNSIGAGASKPFSFHFQATTGKFLLGTAETDWVEASSVQKGKLRSGYGYYTYPLHPMRNVIFDGNNAYLHAFVLIELLNKFGYSYNVVGFEDRVAVFPKSDLHRGMPGAVECLGNVNASSMEEFDQLSTDPSALAERIFRHSLNKDVLADFLAKAGAAAFRFISSGSLSIRPA
jgi:hypothetical protein